NPTDGLVRGLHEGTEGNALFVSEVIRLLLEEGQLQEDKTEPAKVGLPQSVREVIGRRLEHLSTECVRTLTLASVLGREFSLDALAYHFLEGAPGGEVTKAIDYARRAGDTALTLLAYEEAARLYRMALQGLELRAPSDPVARCDLLLNLGDALARGGDQSGSR